MEQPQDAGSQDNTQHVGEVVGGQNTAFFGRAGLILQERVQRDNEQAAEEAGERQPYKRPTLCGHQAQRASGKAQGNPRWRHQPQLNPLAGDAARRHRTRANADRQRRYQKADLTLRAMQRVVHKHDQRQLHQPADKPEERNAGHGQRHRPVLAQDAEAANDFREWVPVKRLLRRRWLYFWNAQAGPRADNRQRDQERAHLPLVVLPVFEEQRAEAAADNDRHKRRQFQQRVGAGQVTLRQQLRQNTVLRRAEKVGLRRQ